MASTRKSPSSELPARVGAALAAHVPAGAHLTLGLSGGIDSIVLLDVLAQLAPRHPFRLSCLHVHHGISPHAQQWAEFACASAARAGCECAVRRVRLDEHPGIGLEAAARAARYAAFAGCDTDFVVFAHQQDDQAETLLLQLVRGAGVAGLAGMPVVRPFTEDAGGTRAARVRLLRPMLDVSRREIEVYARERGLRWIEDESNADTGLARNLVRHRVMPLLRELNPAAPANIARSAAHLADALDLVEAIAAQDLRAALRDDALDLAFVRSLDEARARNLLRAWLARRGVDMPSTARLREALRQLLHADMDAVMAIDCSTHRLCRYADHAYLVASAEAPRADYEVRWTGASPWPLPGLGGSLHFTAATGRGVAATAVRPGALVVRLRQGGERFRPDARRPRRELKKLLQERGIAPWLRDRLPLVYRGERLVCVPGIGVAHDLQPAPGEAGVLIEWIADAS